MNTGVVLGKLSFKYQIVAGRFFLNVLLSAPVLTTVTAFPQPCVDPQHYVPGLDGRWRLVVGCYGDAANPEAGFSAVLPLLIANLGQTVQIDRQAGTLAARRGALYLMMHAKDLRGADALITLSTDDATPRPNLVLSGRINSQQGPAPDTDIPRAQIARAGPAPRELHARCDAQMSRADPVQEG